MARYVAIYDDDGVPVWWSKAPASDAKLLPDGTIGWWQPTSGTTGAHFETHRFDGSLVHTWSTVGTPTDIHDFQMLPNGNALMTAYPPRPGTMDLSAYGGPSTGATLIDGEIQEITPAGDEVWSWSTKDHIPPSETPTRWHALTFGFTSTVSGGRQGVDYAHLNSIQQVGDTVVASFRHLDAVYGIDKTTGAILWKLGGVTTGDSLTVASDPQSGTPSAASTSPACSATAPSRSTTTTPTSPTRRGPCATGSIWPPRPRRGWSR